MDIYTFQTGNQDSPHCVGLSIPFHSILFFGRGRGRGGRATAKPNASRRSSADGFAVRMKRTKAGQGCQILFPVFGGEMATAKIQTVKGLREILFLRFFAEKMRLLVLDGLDRQNGHKTRDCFCDECDIL